VVSQTNGTWGTAKEMPGTAALNQGGDADLSSVSCAAAGGCSAGGAYKDSPHRHHAYVDSETEPRQTGGLLDQHQPPQRTEQAASVPGTTPRL
jgi:hypothetical protein